MASFERVDFSLAQRSANVRPIIGVVAALVTAGLWLRASVIDVPDNIDTIAGELRRMGRWNAWAAFAALSPLFAAHMGCGGDAKASHTRAQ
jgi:hypothetical protein